MMLGNNGYVTATLAQIPIGSVGVELGVWRGDSTARFAQRAARVYAVDSWSVVPYKHDSAEHGTYEDYLRRYARVVGSKNPEDFQKYYNKLYMKVLERFRNEPKVVVCRMTTDEYFACHTPRVDEFPPGHGRSKRFINWVYVDANHSYESCKRDLVNSVDIIKPGGIILGDDYGNKPGVTKAVDEFVRETGFKWIQYGKNQYKIRIL